MNLLPAKEVRSRSTPWILTARTAVAIGLMQALFATPLTSFSQTSAEDAATIAALREQVAALARRLEEVERRQAAQASVPSEGSVARSHDAAVHDELREAQAAAKQARAAAAEAKAAQRQAQAAPAVVPFIGPGPIEGLLPPEEMGSPLDGVGMMPCVLTCPGSRCAFRTPRPKCGLTVSPR